MILRVTINKERVIQHAEAITITGPYAICPTANEVFHNLPARKLAPDGGAKCRPQQAGVMAVHHRDVKPGGNHCLSNPLW